MWWASVASPPQYSQVYLALLRTSLDQIESSAEVKLELILE
jgi:hypothetical protein